MLDTLSYETSTIALSTAEQSIANASQWRQNFDYTIGQVCLMNNSFYSANYSHNSGTYFDTEAWTKINNSADRIKNVTIDDSAKANGKSLVYNSTTNKIEFQTIVPTIIETDVTLSSNSDVITPSSKAVKTYVDNKVSSIATGMEYKGAFDASLGILPTDIKIGDFYKISNSGAIDGIQLNNKDMIIANKTKVGTTNMLDFDVIDNTEEVFNGLTNEDISTNTDFSVDSGKLTDRNTVKTFVENKLGNETLQTTSQTLKGAINETFSLGVSKKENLVSKLTSKGVTGLTTSNTWDEVINSVDNIQTGSSSTQEVTKLNVTASALTPYTHTVSLNNPIIDKNIIYGVREFIQGSTQTNLVSTFNNTDSSNFKVNSNIAFDGSLKLADVVSTNDMINEGVLDVGNLYSCTVDKSQLGKIKNVEVLSESLPYQFKLTALNNPSVAESNGDIDLSNIDTWNSVVFNTVTTNGGKALLAVSVDSGVTYKAYSIGLGAWQTVDITNLSDFSTKGMSKTITDSLTSTELELLRNGSNNVRFAYYFSTPEINSTAESTDISVGIKMMGSYSLANKVDYDVLIGSDNQSIEFKFYKNGTFTMNYSG